MTYQALTDLGRLQNQLADLIDLHPPEEWSPTLLRAVNGVLEMYVKEFDRQRESATVLQLVPRP